MTHSRAPVTRHPPIEDYALLGDTHTAALVSRAGSIDWLCLPRFDSDACFAALLGDPSHGRWLLGPVAEQMRTTRRYRDHSLVLDTDHDTPDGRVRVTDCMPPRADQLEVVRVVRGLEGRVRVRMELVARFEYGRRIPWIEPITGGARLTAGADSLSLFTSVPLHVDGGVVHAELELERHQEARFVLLHHPSHEQAPMPVDAELAIARTEEWWRDWIAGAAFDGEPGEAMLRSLTVLKGLIYSPTGGIVAAPTTSLPEEIGGVRNWDYRYCWIRDATFTLDALLAAGFTSEALAWRDWLLRAVAGEPDQMQLMYTVSGGRQLPERELPWLPGYEGSAPVRVGNAASEQFQLDVYGEVMDALQEAREAGVPPHERAWTFQQRLLERLESNWREPDEGIWEVRGPRRHFTHSKVMAWVAFDRAVRACERSGLVGDSTRWRQRADEVHREVCEHGWNDDAKSFTQSYGSDALDASLLMIPLVGFLSADDPRVKATVEAIERELVVDGFVMRYSPERRTEVDGLPGGEGAFLACSFWLADVYELLGRRDDAETLFARVCGVANDVGLLSEEYDPHSRRLLGNFPQALSHLALLNTGQLISRAHRGESRRALVSRRSARPEEPGTE